MGVYIICPNCRLQYSADKKRCPRCNQKKPKGVAKYLIKIYKHGQTIRKLVTCYLDQAKEVEAKLRSDLTTVEYNLYKDITLKELYNLYLENGTKHLKPETIRRIKDLFKYLTSLHDKKLTSIKASDIQIALNNVLDQGMAVRTAQYILQIVKRLFNYAIENGYYVGLNPTKNVKLPKVDNKRVRWLSREEAQKLLEELKKHSQQTYEIALLSLQTGMRASEIFNLKWSDIDLKNGLIYIKDPKSGENRVAYMTEDVKAILTNKKGKPNEHVFTDRNGNPLNRVSSTFKRVVKKLGFNDNITDPRDKVVFHTLRHTFASWLVMNGTPIYTVKELMGHKTLAMTERYSHLAPNTSKKAVMETFSKK